MPCSGTEDAPDADWGPRTTYVGVFFDQNKAQPKWPQQAAEASDWYREDVNDFYSGASRKNEMVPKDLHRSMVASRERRFAQLPGRW